VIEQEILAIIHNPQDKGEGLNAVANQFRRGRDVSELIELLDSRDAELVSVGAWLLGEIHLALYDFDRFISRLRELVDHEDPMVRFHAFGALFPTLDPREVATQELLKKVLADSNEGVRKSAEAAAARLKIGHLS
jgi:HEAT repeat protein